LRQAIVEANGDGAPTLISFDPAVFPATIALETRLPAIVDAGDTIDAAGLEVIVDGDEVPDVAGERAIGLRIRASDVTVRGLTIQNFDYDGIYVGPSRLDSEVDVTGVTIRENFLINNLDGIRVSGNRGPGNWVGATIDRNILDSNRDDGITVEGSLNNSPGQNVVQVVIRGNRVAGSLGVVTGGTLTGDGIRVLGGRGDGSDNEVFADILNNWTVDNIDDGIVVAGAGGGSASRNFMVTRISNNVVRNNGASTSINGSGIVVRGGSRAGADPAGTDNTVIFVANGNHSMENKDTGIVISGGLGANNDLHGIAAINWASDNGLDGMRVTGGKGEGNRLSHIRVGRNQVRENLRDGLNINGGGGNLCSVDNIVVARNRARGNDRFGILFSPGAGTDNIISVAGIFRNQAMGNIRDGLFVGAAVTGGGGTPIARNRCLYNGEDGIDIDSAGYLLTGNRAIGNTVDGINALGNIDGGGNIAIGNGSCNTPGCY
jgi:hypothetical protein